MLSVHCPAHGREVLLTPGRIDQVMNTTKGIVIRWRCWCGTTGHLVTGTRSWWGAPAEEARDSEGWTGAAEAVPDVEPAVPPVESAA